MCPSCGGEWKERDGNTTCEDCGFQLWSDDQIAVREETLREYLQDKVDCFPSPVPTYGSSYPCGCTKTSLERCSKHDTFMR